MREIDDVNGKHVLVLGLAKSGFAAINLLLKLGAKVTVNERREIEGDESLWLENRGIKAVGGSHPVSLLDENVDFVVKNPGIPYTNPMVEKAQEMNIPVWTEVELAYRVNPGCLVGITGSNGKTTTTTMVFEMLDEMDKPARLAGNIGYVASEVVQEATSETTVVTELSSFQLQGTETFRPNIAVFLNVVDAHLDYHGTREAYQHAKAQLFANQTKTDVLIYNADDPTVCQLVSNADANKRPFSMSTPLKEGAYVQGGMIYLKGEPLMRTRDVALPGDYNIENALAASLAANESGVSAEVIRSVLENFQGVKHRLQYVDTVNERTFYNNSKATNILATQKALSAFPDKPVVLIAGGLDRGNEFDELIEHLNHYVHHLVCYGETANKLANAGHRSQNTNVSKVNTLEEAVEEAYRQSNQGDMILLSPACASWDQFSTFEERGDRFIQCVENLSK
ncbi:UDP-N-acetylmuramoyl-L-alanine--D-glutamate ligase [Texcoconibacillus texcoconensis]|uniref:UDP-N-acetylmuramoylalanine--D-glutamate ligase n=1 Tax=Texcoconibacillus texcoconensis TaxID=1095777 RepID=A0A840QLC7_9BACI|nr:UDP-N-acetylmuramoyl-L-alanine--D-glutamate ligase [Texcoconibacillus texcoconensis]MBB5172174.1 UDP-N-acetylmuramoylalanine--D-glutamate ligase [Texcoconibacillus texcoconensis]